MSSQSPFLDLYAYYYELKHPRDTFGEEHSENARICLTYLDLAEDRDKVNGWNDALNSFLVFVSSFL